MSITDGVRRVPSTWNAGLLLNPFGWIIARPRKSSSKRPCCSRSASFGKLLMSLVTAAALPRSLCDMPISSVAQRTKS